MKERFEGNYVGELLSDACMPGMRLWSTILDMQRPGREFKWVPWAQILSKSQESQILELPKFLGEVIVDRHMPLCEGFFSFFCRKYPFFS